MCLDLYLVINRERLGGHEIYARTFYTDEELKGRLKGNWY